MSAWWLSFSGIMIVAPLVCALAVRPSADPEAEPLLARRLTGWLVLSTLAALALMIGLWQLWGVRAGLFGWPLFFPLCFLLALPAMRARNPAWRAPHSAQPRLRTASLAGDRARVDPVAAWIWKAAWALFAVVLAVIAARPLLSPIPGAGFSTGWMRWTIALAVAGTTLPTLLIVTPMCIRASLREPEPMDTARSPALAEAYADLRRCKAWFFTVLFLVMAIVVGAAMLALAWIETDQGEQAMGLAGGVAGGVIGLAGAVGGILMDRRRVRINALLRELERDQRQVARA